MTPALALLALSLLLAFGIGATAPFAPWNRSYYNDHYRSLARKDARRTANRKEAI
jgi:hypothetical protein